MTKEESFIPLREILVNNLKLKGKNVKIMYEENVAVVCVNEGARKKRILPFKSLYDNNNTFWLQSTAWEFFLSKEDFAMVSEKAADKPDDFEVEIVQANDCAQHETNEPVDPLEEIPVEIGFGKEYEEITGMSTDEQVELINEDNQRLHALITGNSKDVELVTETIVNCTMDAAMVNHAILESAMNLADDDAKKMTQNLVDSTCAMVKSSAHLVSEDIFDNELMNALVAKSNGTIVQHMTRVYLNGLAFLMHYNRLVATSSTTINRLRISFASKYRDFYGPLLPDLEKDALSLERVFRNGMRAISKDFYYDWAVGFLIHDIGKATAVEYHEGEATYNRKIVIEHVRQGYTSIMNKTNYPLEAGLITGYHHEYYGDAAGYGYFRGQLKQYKKKHPYSRQEYCIAFEQKSMKDFRTKAYFPAKVLEIIDVYDSVTDPNRIYHKAMAPEQALNMMREEFIEKHPKLDVILFDMFESYVHEKKAA